MLDIWKERLADQLVSPDEMPAPLAVPDKWIAHSLVHKAVRRGDAALAGAAGATLLDLDRGALWKTLLTTAFEDVGIGDEAAMIACAAAYSDAAWRAKVGGDLRVSAEDFRRIIETVVTQLPDLDRIRTRLLADTGQPAKGRLL